MSPEEVDKSIVNHSSFDDDLFKLIVTSFKKSENFNLFYFLNALHEQNEFFVSLSFNELQSSSNTNLPQEAYYDKRWWSNKTTKWGRLWMLAGWKMLSVSFIEQKVTFLEDKNIFEKVISKRNSWSNITVFFRKIPNEQKQISITFDELGKIRGSKLPDTAYKDRPWWANTSGSQGSAWLSSGWEVENVYLQAQITVFRRKNSNYMSDIQEYIKTLLGKPNKFNPADQKTLAEWICFCPKIGWYFEAKTLFEKGGLRLDTFDEVKQVELKEAYQISQHQLYLFQNNL